jgi:hypothetical protein
LIGPRLSIVLNETEKEEEGRGRKRKEEEGRRRRRKEEEEGRR